MGLVMESGGEKRRRGRLLSVFWVLAVFVMTGYFVLTHTAKFQAKTALSGEAREIPPTNVEILVVEPTAFEDRVVVNGQISAWEEVVLSAETAGIIEWIGVHVGDKVKQGQELARIDTTSIRIAYEQAAARETLARQELERMKALRKSQAVSQQDLDRAQTQADVAAADLRAVEDRLKKSVVTAPIQGLVNQRFKEPHEFVDTGTPLIHLVRVDKVKAVAALPERDVNAVRIGDSAVVTIEAAGNKTCEGKVYRIGTSADPFTRTFPVEVELDNSEGCLRPGMTCRVFFVRARYEPAVVIPLFSVLTLENERFVAVEENGTAHFRRVLVGAIEGDRAYIAEGLHPGDHLIVTGHREVRDGHPVRVLNQVTR